MKSKYRQLAPAPNTSYPIFRTCARLAEGYNLDNVWFHPSPTASVRKWKKINTTWQNTGRATRALTKLKPNTINPDKRGHIVADTLWPMMFLGMRKLGNICCGHKMFLKKIRNTFCVPDTKFVSATTVAREGKRGNICVNNNVSATMCPRLPGRYKQ